MTRPAIPRISTLTLAGTDLRLVLLSCPGVRGQVATPQVSAAFLRDDTAALAARDVGLLVSLVQDRELRLGAGAHAAACGAAGIALLRAPIPDMQPPGPAQEPALGDAVTAARQVMAGGRAVAIHCMAGLGRTGTIAARIAMTYGLDAPAAIAFIRANHDPAAIETAAQEAYLHGLG